MLPADPPGGHGAASTAIAEDLDVFEARWSVRRVAAALGFASRDINELVVAASELATNILKFGSPGLILVEGIEHPEYGCGIRITARDSGAPMGDFEQILARSTVVGAAMEWTGRGLGGGLGAVYRFTDVLTYAPCDGGKQIVVERYLDRPPRGPR